MEHYKLNVIETTEVDKYGKCQTQQIESYKNILTQCYKIIPNIKETVDIANTISRKSN